MILNYQTFIDRVIHKYEGGYGWNKKDPGGPTNFGITCFDLAEHRGQKMNSMETWAPLVRDMPLSEAEAIYRVKYAGQIHFDELPSGIDCTLLDYGINSGSSRPIRVARALLGLTPAGEVDKTMLDAINKVSPKAFITAVNQERLKFMHAIRGGDAWAEFGHGWQARVTDLENYSQNVAAKTVSTVDVDLSHVVTPKATNVAPTYPKTTMGGAVATGAVLGASAQPWYFIAGGVVLVVIAGVVYELYKESQAAAANNMVHV